LQQRRAAPGTFLRRRFFVPQFNGTTATLEGPAAHHLARVLRAEPGQLYELSDGQKLCLARVEHVGRDQVDFAVMEPLPARAPKLEATLLLAVVKFDCFEWAIEKATELGATSIVPLAAARSEKALLAAAPKRAARWEKIVFEAAQQSRCLRPPQILSLATPREAFGRDTSAVRVLMSERAGDPTMKDVLAAAGADGAAATSASAPVRLSLGVGPEGGWADGEFADAAGAGFRAASFGSNILRAETAVLAGLAAAHLYFD
jgi:16S rRNA (uracil1498-N3)-methyltransferase